jgi:hypothetical protein
VECGGLVDPEPRRAAAFEANTKAPTDEGTLPSGGVTLLAGYAMLGFLTSLRADGSESILSSSSLNIFPNSPAPIYTQRNFPTFLATCTSSVPTLSCAQQIPQVSYAVTVTQPPSVPTFLSHTRATQSIALPLFLSFQWLADSFSLLPLFFASPPFVFNRLHTLSAKHRGWGYLRSCHSRVRCHKSRVTQLCAPFVFMVL